MVKRFTTDTRTDVKRLASHQTVISSVEVKHGGRCHFPSLPLLAELDVGGSGLVRLDGRIWICAPGVGWGVLPYLTYTGTYRLIGFGF